MAAVAPTGQGSAVARMRILLIEDERDLTELLTYNLNREGYETLVAHDGQEGLRKAQTLLPELIILDMMLPTLDGQTVLRELRAGDRTRDIPVIILSAKAEEMDQVEVFGARRSSRRNERIEALLAQRRSQRLRLIDVRFRRNQAVVANDDADPSF